jgi:hypothetical protein
LDVQAERPLQEPAELDEELEEELKDNFLVQTEIEK